MEGKLRFWVAKWVVRLRVSQSLAMLPYDLACELYGIDSHWTAGDAGDQSLLTVAGAKLVGLNKTTDQTSDRQPAAVNIREGKEID